MDKAVHTPCLSVARKQLVFIAIHHAVPVRQIHILIRITQIFRSADTSMCGIKRLKLLVIVYEFKKDAYERCV